MRKMSFGNDKGTDGSILTLARSNTILGNVSSITIERLLGHGQPVEIDPRQVLIRQGDFSDCAYLILDGELEIAVNTAHGEVHFARVSRGALIGEIGVFADLPRNATVRACTSVRAMRFPRAHLLAAGDSDPALLRSVNSGLGRLISRFNNAIGLFTNAVAALEQGNFDANILDALRQPSPELVDFAQHFRRMAEQIVHRRAQQEEMASAAAIQRAMLPSAQPTNLEGRFDIFMQMLPAREVGGDLYDVVELGKDRLVITIGDVCGKGVPASLFMAVTQTVMRLVLRFGQDLPAEIGAANKLLVANNRESMFATLICGVLDLALGTMIYCNCGHNPALVLRRGSRQFESLRSNDPPLGVADDIAYASQSVALAPGDMLFLYTDGITEAENPDSIQFGTQRLEQAILEVRGQPARRTVEQVIGSVRDFVKDTPQSDDITCIAIIRNEG